jgi:hypothetical protein
MAPDTGEVDYDLPPIAEREGDQVLLCCSHPIRGSDVVLEV